MQRNQELVAVRGAKPVARRCSIIRPESPRPAFQWLVGPTGCETCRSCHGFCPSFLVILAPVTIFVASGAGDFVLGILGLGPKSGPAAFAIWNAVVIIAGLTVVGSLAPESRWANIMFVTARVWVLIGFINVALGLVSIASWVACIVVLAVCASIAGVISLLVTALIRSMVGLSSHPAK